LKESLEIFSSINKEHPKLSKVYLAIASLKDNQNKFNKAEQYYNSFLQNILLNYGDNH
jgi:hypothetical protein